MAGRGRGIPAERSPAVGLDAGLFSKHWKKHSVHLRHTLCLNQRMACFIQENS
jgi:hypothetical protein